MIVAADPAGRLRHTENPDTCAVVIDDDLVVMDLRGGDYSCIPDWVAAPPGLSGVADAFASDRAAASAAWVPMIEGDAAVACRHIPSARGMPEIRDVLFLLGLALAVAFNSRRAPRHWLKRHGLPVVDRDITEARLSALVHRFRRASLWVPGISLCLANSMALAAFLRRHGARTRWVFGVRTYPFEAHCWLEWRDIMLNDVLDHSRWFTPILVA